MVILDTDHLTVINVKVIRPFLFYPLGCVARLPLMSVRPLSM